MENEISNRKRKSSKSGIKSLKDQNGTIIEDPQKIANRLNDHFSTVGSVMANEINSQSVSPRDPLSYIKKNVDSSLFLSYTSAFEIFKCISKLENKKSSGYDCISNSILKSTNQAISPYLEILFKE